MPFSAVFMRIWRSKAKGFVTTPTVRMPISLAMVATMGAAPVPVPPPIPAVTNTISDPLIASAISSRFSSAALAPTSGRPPAPRPRVVFSPICMRVGAWEYSSAWLSVLITTYSTPWIPRFRSCGSRHCCRLRRRRPREFSRRLRLCSHPFQACCPPQGS